MKIRIEQDGQERTGLSVESLSAVPEGLFAASQYFGGGEFVAFEIKEDGALEPVYRLSCEWLEAEDA